MRAAIVENRIHVTLSRRNLRELQTMLDDRSGHRRSLGRVSDNRVFLVVEVEEDAGHYEGLLQAPSDPVVHQRGG
jgi:hypothetical protein